MLRKKMYTWFVVCFSIQGRQKRITTFTGVCPLPRPLLTSCRALSFLPLTSSPLRRQETS